MFVLVLAVLFAAAYLGRARIGALWRQVTGKAPPVWVMPEKPEREGPEVEGRGKKSGHLPISCVSGENPGAATGKR
jgi:hypothetical protein